jgi:hypothetical protein
VVDHVRVRRTSSHVTPDAEGLRRACAQNASPEPQDPFPGSRRGGTAGTPPGPSGLSDTDVEDQRERFYLGQRAASTLDLTSGRHNNKSVYQHVREVAMPRRTLNRIIAVSVAAIVSLVLLVSAPAAFAATWKLFDVFTGPTAGQDCRAEGQQGLADHSPDVMSASPAGSRRRPRPPAGR